MLFTQGQIVRVINDCKKYLDKKLKFLYNLFTLYIYLIDVIN